MLWAWLWVIFLRPGARAQSCLLALQPNLFFLRATHAVLPNLFSCLIYLFIKQATPLRHAATEDRRWYAGRVEGRVGGRRGAAVTTFRSS